MAQLRINHFWLWFLSLLFTIALVILTLPILKPLTSSLFYPESRLDGLHSSYEDRTIYNPGENVLGGPKLRGSRPNFLYEFHERHDLESLDSTADETWNNAMSTPLGGFLLVQHNETYQRGWGVSMFHSLHCLGMLRASLQSHFGLNPEGGDHGTHMHGSGRRRGEEKRFSVDERQHAEHCIGYIARALLCNGDDTLEPPIDKLDGNGNILLSLVNGEGHQHSCRDSTFAWQTVFGSETEPVPSFKWSPGDTIRSVFGSK